MRSRRALLAALGFDETRDLGVKKRLNFRGVIDGFLRSLAWLGGGGGSLGGEERRLLLESTLKLFDGAAGLFACSMAVEGQTVEGQVQRWPGAGE